MNNYWEEFKNQAKSDYMKINHEMAFAIEFDSDDEVSAIKPVLRERERILNQICEIDETETVESLLGFSKKQI